MKMKLTTLLFGLLLAVGWTNVAQAQLKAESQLESLIKFGPSERMDDEVLARKFKAPNRAPMRAQYNITADKTMTRAEYEAITYNWVDANGYTHPGTKITEPASNPYQIAYLLGTTYMNKEIPGIKYSAFTGEDHPYPNIEFGWDIPNNSRWPGNSGGGDTPTTSYNDITISIASYSLVFNSIQVQSNGTTVPGGSWTYASNGATLPTGWSTSDALLDESDYGGCSTQQYGGTITIPHSLIDGKENITVVMSARKYSDGSTTTNCTVTISGATPESNTYTSTDYTEKTWNINPTSNSGSSSGNYYPNGLTIGTYGPVLISSITVYDQNNNTLTSWNATTAVNNGQYDDYTSGGNTYSYFTIPGWNYSFYFRAVSYSNAYYGYFYGEHLNFPPTSLNGKSSLRVVVTGRTLDDYDGEAAIVVNGEEQDVTTTATSYQWTITGTDAATRTVDKPDYNGYTVFLVKAKDNAGDPYKFTYSWNKNGFSSLINFFDTYIDEVELLTDGLRLNENTDDAGTMFSYSGELNKFYFISKGANYLFGSSESLWWPHYGPTYDMYEEFSPTTTAAGDEITDFYSKLLYGNSYNVLHDCRGVNVMQHYFSMSGNAGTEHSSLTNLIFWIPDNRAQQNNQNNYNEEYLPLVGLYTITLEAEAEQVAQNYTPGNRNYRVDLDWVSSLNSILDFDVDQDYELWVYYYDEQGNPVEDYKVTDLIVDENGLIHNDTEHSYYVEQKPESYTIVYRIKGWPKDATNSPGKHLDDPENGTFYALSNLDPVVIPGYNDFLSLGVEHYESDFALDGDYAEHNYYRNFLTVGNQNPDNALNAQRIYNNNADHQYLLELYRYDVDKEETTMTKAADLTFSIENSKVKYNIVYDNQFYVDEASIYNEYNDDVLKGYTDPNALGCPTSGEIANISSGGTIEPPVVVDQFKRITSLDDITDDGEYLFVYENGNLALDGSRATLDASGNSINVSFSSDGTIETTDAILASTFSITRSGSRYAIKSKSGYYIHNYQRNKNGLQQSATLSNNYLNTISFTGRNVNVLSTYQGTFSTYNYYLQYNTQDNRFRYFTSTQQSIQLYKRVSDESYSDGLMNDFLDNSTYTQVGIVVFQLPWKSINVKLQEGETASSAGYFKIENGGKLKFVMPAGYNNASLRFVIHNAPVTSDYFDGTFTLVKKSTGETKTITIPKTSNYGDRDYEVIFNGMSSGDVITITGTHTHNGTLYGYSPDFKYIHVYVEGGHDGVAMTDALNLDAIKFVDQFKAETREDKHPYRYGYVLKAVGNNDESSSPEIPVQHTNSKVNGFYSLNDINNDIICETVDPVNAMNANVNMTLSREPEIYYYTLDRKPSNENNAQWEAISKLQKRGNTDSYQEMFDNLPQYEDQICNPPAVTTPPTPWIVERYDNHDVKVGGYNSYMSYVPIIWTHGDQKNRRIKWDIENRHNSYGAPIWKTGVADVTLTSAIAERQDNISTKWTYGSDECSLYMLDNIEAVAKMPTVNNVKYVPYMFRIFVKSNNHKLRGYQLVAEDVDPNKPGEHFEGAPINNDALQCVWSGYVNDPNNGQYGVTITENEVNGAKTYTFHKDKVERTNPQGEWDKNKENAIFASLESLIQGEGENMMINGDDLSIIVRFYYIVEGFDASAPGTSRGEGADPAGYGVEGEGRTPSPWTAVSEIGYNSMIESVTYVNALGMQSDKPFDGVNIVITRYSNGTVSTTKVVR